MVDVMTQPSALGALLADTTGVVGAALGTAGGELRAVTGRITSGEASVAAAAAITRELATLGHLFELGELAVASLKAAGATRVFSRRASAVLAIELEPERPLGELEAKLRALVWSPEDLHGPAVVRTLSSEPAALPPPPSPAPRSTGVGPVFAGDLEELGVADLLEFLRSGQRTGLLICTTPAGIGSVQLRRGMIVGADSPSALGLRQHLLNDPELAPERRRALAAVAAERFGDDAIDEVVGSGDLVSRDEVDRARVARIYSAIREMIGWASGRFSFDPSAPVAAKPGPALGVQSVLMQICQEQDDQAQAEQADQAH